MRAQITFELLIYLLVAFSFFTLTITFLANLHTFIQKNTENTISNFLNFSNSINQL